MERVDRTWPARTEVRAAYAVCGMGPPPVRVRRKLSKSAQAHRGAVPLLPRALYGSDFRSPVA